jgi:hypothetical protein
MQVTGFCFAQPLLDEISFLHIQLCSISFSVRAQSTNVTDVCKHGRTDRRADARVTRAVRRTSKIIFQMHSTLCNKQMQKDIIFDQQVAMDMK